MSEVLFRAIVIIQYFENILIRIETFKKKKTTSQIHIIVTIDF